MLRGDGDIESARCAVVERTPPYAGHRLGLIGHYAARDVTAAARLLDLARTVLAEHGCTLAVGPMDGSTWQNYRLIIELGDEPPLSWSPIIQTDGPTISSTADSPCWRTTIWH